MKTVKNGIRAVEYCTRVILLYNDKNRIKLPGRPNEENTQHGIVMTHSGPVGKVSRGLRPCTNVTQLRYSVSRERPGTAAAAQYRFIPFVSYYCFTPAVRFRASNIAGAMIAADAAGLTVPFAILCIVDLFGIFPIIVLPGPIIKCGK